MKYPVGTAAAVVVLAAVVATAQAVTTAVPAGVPVGSVSDSAAGSRRLLRGSVSNELVSGAPNAIDWALHECQLTNASKEQCPAGAYISCCDGTGCTSFADNRYTTCYTQYFLGCCGGGTVDYALDECKLSTASPVTCPVGTYVTCCDGTGCTGFADGSDVKCLAEAFIGCCSGGKKKKKL